MFYLDSNLAHSFADNSTWVCFFLACTCFSLFWPLQCHWFMHSGVSSTIWLLFGFRSFRFAFVRFSDIAKFYLFSSRWRLNQRTFITIRKSEEWMSDMKNAFHFGGWCRLWWGRSKGGREKIDWDLRKFDSNSECLIHSGLLELALVGGETLTHLQHHKSIKHQQHCSNIIHLWRMVIHSVHFRWNTCTILASLQKHRCLDIFTKFNGKTIYFHFKILEVFANLLFSRATKCPMQIEWIRMVLGSEVKSAQMITNFHWFIAFAVYRIRTGKSNFFSKMSNCHRDLCWGRWGSGWMRDKSTNWRGSKPD